MLTAEKIDKCEVIREINVVDCCVLTVEKLKRHEIVSVKLICYLHDHNFVFSLCCDEKKNYKMLKKEKKT